MSTFSLGTKLVQAVQKEAAMQRPLPLLATAQDTISVKGKPDHSVTASVVLVDNDRFSHMVEAMIVEVTPVVGSKSAHRGDRDATTRGQRFAQSTTYLTEALQFVEQDQGGSAVLRSTPATMLAPRAEYFEATVGETQISLKRYQPHTDKPGRAQVPFCLTDEVLTRLANDATAVLVPSPRK